MPAWHPSILQRFQYPTLNWPQYSPHPAPRITHGKSVQCAKIDNATKLDENCIKQVQSIVGSILYGAILIDSPALVSVTEIGSQQTNSTINALNLCSWLLNFIATYPNPSMTHKRSEMILHVASDSSYLSTSNSRSRVGGCHFLGNKIDPKMPIGNQFIFYNAPIHVEASILKHVMPAASESEIAWVFVNAKLAIPERVCLLEMWHPRPATPLETPNTTAYGMLTKELIPKRSKGIAVRFFWLRDRANKNFTCTGKNAISTELTTSPNTIRLLIAKN